MNFKLSFLFLGFFLRHLALQAQIDSCFDKKQLREEFKKDHKGFYNDYSSEKFGYNSMKVYSASFDGRISYGGVSSKMYYKIPEKVYSFSTLHELRFESDSLYQEDFERLKEFKCLKFIYLNSTGLVNFPLKLCEIPKLIELEFYRNYLKKIPAAIFEHPQLQKLSLQWQLSDTLYLPTKLSSSNLTDLDLSRCKLYWIPAGFCNLPKLKGLNLEFTKIKTLPKEIYQFKSLEMIEISNTPLENIPLEMGLLENLVTIGLNHTKLKKFPECLFKLKNIQRIHLIGTECTSSDEEREAIYKRFEEMGNKKVVIFW